MFCYGSNLTEKLAFVNFVSFSNCDVNIVKGRGKNCVHEVYKQYVSAFAVVILII